MGINGIELSLDPERIGTELHLRYTLGIDVVVRNVVKDRAGWPAAEVKIDVDARAAPESKFLTRTGGIMAFRGRVSLSSQSSKKDTWTTCYNRVGEIEKSTWEALIEDVSDRAISSVQERVKPEQLGKYPTPMDRPKYQVYPLLPSKQPTLLWGASDIGKSWLGVYLCALVDNGLTNAGMTADAGKSLYVDYETSSESINERVLAVKAGLPDEIPNDWTLAYQTARGPLVDWIDDLAGYVDRMGITFVVLDSVGLALAGAFNEGEAVLAFFEAIRQMDATTLLIDHQGKGEDAKDRGAIGSSYKRHMARSVWEMRRSEGGEKVTIGLYHRKANNSRKSPPIGLTLDILSNNDGVADVAIFERFKLGESAELAEGLPLPKRIMAALKDGALTVEEIRERMPDVTDQSLKKALSRGAGSLWIRLERGRYGIQHQAAS